MAEEEQDAEWISMSRYVEKIDRIADEISRIEPSISHLFLWKNYIDHAKSLPGYIDTVDVFVVVSEYRNIIRETFIGLEGGIDSLQVERIFSEVAEGAEVLAVVYAIYVDYMDWVARAAVNSSVSMSQVSDEQGLARASREGMATGRPVGRKTKNVQSGRQASSVGPEWKSGYENTAFAIVDGLNDCLNKFATKRRKIFCYLAFSSEILRHILTSFRDIIKVDIIQRPPG